MVIIIVLLNNDYYIEYGYNGDYDCFIYWISILNMVLRLIE